MKTKFSLFIYLSFATATLCAANRSVNLSLFTGAIQYTTITDALAASASGDMVYLSVGTYAEEELNIPAGVIVIGGMPISATVCTDRIFPGKDGITTGQQTLLNGGGGFAVSRTPHRVVTVNGTLDGCVVLNGYNSIKGGGVLITATGTVQNCIIRGNQCQNTANNGMGGGAYLLGNARLLNSIIDFNMAQQGCAMAGAGTTVNNTIAHNTNAPTWVKILAGGSNTFPYGNLANTAGTTSWFANAYYLAQTLTTVAQYAVFANATLVPNITSQKTFSNAEREAKYNWYPAGVSADAVGFSCSLFTAEKWGLQYLNNLWVANTGMEKRPMDNVSWYGSLAYSQWIGGGLPTDAEWEYAARRTASGYSNNTYAGTNAVDPNYFWYLSNSSSSTQAVATKLPNGIGLYDMSGNEWEWCASWYNTTLTYGADPTGATTGNSRTLRGGSWSYPASYMTVLFRNHLAPNMVSNNFGFRPEVQ